MNNLQSTTAPVTVRRLLDSLVAGLGPATRVAYARDWARVAQWAGQSTPEALLQWLCSQGRAQCHLTMLDWRTEALNAPYAPSTINRTLAAVQFLLKAAYAAELIDWTVTMPRLKVTKLNDIRGPEDKDIKKILTVCNQRDTAIVLLLYTLGLRRAEICSLNVGSLNGTRLMVKRKGKHEETPHTVPQSTVDAINTYLSTRPQRKPSDPMFVNNTGNRTTGPDIYYMVRRRAKDAGVTAPINPHRFRHSAASDAVEANNGNVADLAAFMGHASPATSQVYLDRQNDAQGRVANLLADRLDRIEEMT